MKYFFSLILLSSLIISCKKQQKPQEQYQGLSFGSALSINRVLNAPETRLAKAACLILRDKREYFETLEDNKWEFDFEGYEQSCGRSRHSIGRFNTRLRVPSRGPVYFESNFSRYFDQLLTDKEGFLSFYCEDLLNNRPTYLIQDVGGKKLQLEVTSAQKLIIIGGAWYFPNDRGVYTSYLIDKAAIHTAETTRNRRLIGVIKERTQSRRCDNGAIKSYQQRLR